MFGNARRGVSSPREDDTVINTHSSLFYEEIKHVIWPHWHEYCDVNVSWDQAIIQIVYFTHSTSTSGWNRRNHLSEPCVWEGKFAE